MSASRTGRTSWTRTICTPCTARPNAAPTVALVRSASLSPMSLPKKPLREWPTSSGQLKGMKFVTMTHEREVMFVCFAKADAGIEANSLARDAGGTRARRAARADSRALRRQHRSTSGFPASSAACPACASRTRRRRCPPPTPIIAASPVKAGHVVDDLGAGLNRRAGDRRLARIDRNRNLYLADERLNDRQHAPQLLVHRYGFGVRPRTLAADVQQVGAIGY